MSKKTKPQLDLLALMARKAPPMPTEWYDKQFPMSLLDSQALWSSQWAIKVMDDLQKPQTPTGAPQTDPVQEGFTDKKASAARENEQGGWVSDVTAMTTGRYMGASERLHDPKLPVPPKGATHAGNAPQIEQDGHSADDLYLIFSVRDGLWLNGHGKPITHYARYAYRYRRKDALETMGEGLNDNPKLQLKFLAIRVRDLEDDIFQRKIERDISLEGGA